jgi:transposase
MARPYSSDLRQRAIALVETGQSRRAVARLLGLDKSTVILWAKEYRSTGKQAAKPMGGRRRFALLAERDWLLARIAAAPDLTVRALRTELAERGTKVSYDAVWRFLREERLTFKKKLYAPPSRTARTSRASARAGSVTRAALTPRAWSLSTRPGPRPT